MDLMEALVARRNQLRMVVQRPPLVDVGHSCLEQVSIDHPAEPFV